MATQRMTALLVAAILVLAAPGALAVDCNNNGVPDDEELGPFDGYALVFDGNDDVVDLGNPAAVNPTTAITLEAWVRTDAIGVRQAVINKPYSGGGEPYYQYNLEIRATGELYFALSVGGVRKIVDTTGFAVTAGQWHHLAATYDGTTMRLYRDGVAYTTPTVHAGSLSNYATNLAIGAALSGAANPTDGTIDEVRIWNGARSAGEIQANMDQALTGSESGLVGYWRFDTGSGLSAVDSTVNGNDGTLTGGPAWLEQTPDSDGDGVIDDCDPCPLDNPDDTDGDGVCESVDLCPGTVPGAPVNPDGCPSPPIPADFDNDGDVDQGDVDAFEICASGPTVPLTPGCEDTDFDSDNDTDQEDFGIVQRCLSGEDIPGDPNCTCDGGTTVDCHGVCDGSGVLDCAGDCDGAAVIGSQGGCCLPPEMDCAGICFGSSTPDCNGVCDGPGVVDCDGICCGPEDPFCQGTCCEPAVIGAGGGCCLPGDQDPCGVCFGDGRGLTGCGGGSGECGGTGSCECDVCNCPDPYFGAACSCTEYSGAYNGLYQHSYIEPTPDTLMQTGQDVSVELWIKPAKVGNPIFMRVGSSGFVWALSAGTVGSPGAPNVLRVFNGDTCGTCDHEGVTVIPTDVWTHVAMTWNGLTHSTQMYINGVPDGPSGTFDPRPAASGQLLVGLLGSSYYGGQMDEVRFWKAERSAGDILLHYDRSLDGYGNPNIVFNHNFQSWSAGDVSCIDYSEAGNNLVHSLFVSRVANVTPGPLATTNESCPNNCNGAGTCSCGVCNCVDPADFTFDCGQSGGGG